MEQTETEAKEFFLNQILKKVSCPKCSSPGFKMIKRDHYYRCKKCEHQWTIKSLTVFKEMRIRLKDAVSFIHRITHEDPFTYDSLSLSLGIPRKTVYRMLKRIRTALEE